MFTLERGDGDGIADAEEKGRVGGKDKQLSALTPAL